MWLVHILCNEKNPASAQCKAYKNPQLNWIWAPAQPLLTWAAASKPLHMLFTQVLNYTMEKPKEHKRHRKKVKLRFMLHWCFIKKNSRESAMLRAWGWDFAYSFINFTSITVHCGSYYSINYELWSLIMANMKISNKLQLLFM